jgi:hypothetical protein
MPKSSASFGGPNAPARGIGGRPKVVGHIRDLARQQTPEAFATIIELMKSKAIPPAVRLAAAQEIVNRGYGKPPATMAGEDGEGLPELVVRWLDERAE